MHKTHTLIVGQGLAGSLLALELYQNKSDFLVIDKASPMASSLVAAGLFTPLVFRNLRKVIGIDEYLPVMKEAYPSMEELLGVRFAYQIPSVKLIPASHLKMWKGALNSPSGAFINRLQESHDICGVRTGYGAAWIEPSGYIDVANFVISTRKWLKGKALYLPGKVDYEQLKTEKKHLIINNLIQADKVVFCEGAAGIHNPWFGMKGFSLNKGDLMEIYAPKLDQRNIIRGEVFILPLGNGHFRVGATYSHDLSDYQPTKQGLAELISKLEKIINTPYNITGHYSGIRPGVKDRMPLLGSHPKYTRLATFNGLGSKGVMYGPYYAKIMRQWLLGERENLPENVDVKRYFKNEY